jgi:phosphatidylinositol-3,4,5-trisphosphate 3-phosphatase/dual-specificity protein phosphatase PTEN
LLFVICGKIHEFLSENDDNVVVINCRAGKGRTGTIICCYLLYSGRFSYPEDAFIYYSYKRFKKGDGVTQPSQKKYVYYFYVALNEKIYFPYIRIIKAITLKELIKHNTTAFGTGMNVLHPYFEIYLNNSDKLSYSNKASFLEQKSVLFNKSDNSAIITENDFSFYFSGDITIKIYNNNMLSTQKLGRVSFNSAFLTKDQTELKFHLKEIDPDDLGEDKRISKDYQIIISFGKMCKCNNEEFPINLCNRCKDYFAAEQQLSDWDEIRTIINQHITLNKTNDEMSKKVKTLLFGKIYWDDINKVLDEVNSNSNKKHLLEGIETGEGTSLPMYDFDDDSEDSDDGCRCDSIIKEENDMCYVKEDECNSSFENECLVF